MFCAGLSYYVRSGRQLFLCTLGVGSLPQSGEHASRNCTVPCVSVGMSPWLFVGWYLWRGPMSDPGHLPVLARTRGVISSVWCVNIKEMYRKPRGLVSIFNVIKVWGGPGRARFGTTVAHILNVRITTLVFIPPLCYAELTYIPKPRKLCIVICCCLSLVGIVRKNARSHLGQLTFPNSSGKVQSNINLPTRINTDAQSLHCVL